MSEVVSFDDHYLTRSAKKGRSGPQQPDVFFNRLYLCHFPPDRRSPAFQDLQGTTPCLETGRLFRAQPKRPDIEARKVIGPGP